MHISDAVVQPAILVSGAVRHGVTTNFHVRHNVVNNSLNPNETKTYTVDNQVEGVVVVHDGSRRDSGVIFKEKEHLLLVRLSHMESMASGAAAVLSDGPMPTLNRRAARRMASRANLRAVEDNMKVSADIRLYNTSGILGPEIPKLTCVYLPDVVYQYINDTLGPDVRDL